MLSQNAARRLRAAGKSFGESVPERGVFTREQLQSAIDGIEAAIAADERAHAAPADHADDHDKQPVHPIAQTVELHQRAYPLLDMLRSEEHTSELQSLMRLSYAVFCLKQKNTHNDTQNT